MATKTITKLDSNNLNVGKADEIEFLRKVVESLPQGSYLSSFFSKAMVEWLEGQIRDDFACDLYADYTRLEDEKIELNRKSNNEKRDLSKAVDDLQATVSELQEKLSAKEKERVFWCERVAACNDNFDSLQQTLNNVYAEKDALEAALTDMEYSRDSWKKTAYSNRDSADEVLAALNDERKAKAELEAVAFVQKQDILKLKADLYDLIMNGKEVK